MKSYTFQDGGSNALYYWGYICEYVSRARIIWVVGVGTFTKTGRAVIDDFGNLVEVA
jgi:hypothetical protein